MDDLMREAEALRGQRTDVPNMTLTAPKALVEVYLHQGRNLPEITSASQNDFYCVVEVTGSRQLYNSHVAQDTLHPVWNESFQVKVGQNDDQMVSISLFAERAGRDDKFVGVVVVPVRRVEAAPSSEEGGWYEMRGEDNGMVSGPEGVSKLELTLLHKPAEPGLQPRMGWLTKRHNLTMKWERRFFILDPYNQMLRFFASPEHAQSSSPEILGEMNIRCCDVVTGISKLGGGGL
mmetsp:Transcript_25186/g.58113  ORF Transcript_25186/g.58113 Transcript_25186/m.58113 type:complete len:234 (-) Transcript_25186:17-718(-)